MATRLNMAFLAAIFIAAFIQSSAAQTTHTVGDTTGWTIAQGGATFYSNWASSQTFAVGDVLVFNFAANAHDVAKVTKADYDGCTTTNPILLETTSPARISINATGEHYFICNFTGHCSAGQKLMINVSAATAPAPQPSSSSPVPQPSTPTPVSAPSPSPVSTPPTSPVSAPSPSTISTPPPSPISTPPPVTYTVGDDRGWSVFANAESFYQNWTSGKTFNAGDILVFNYSSGAHDVSEVTEGNYDSCNTANPIFVNNTAPTIITLTSGKHFYICTISGHCQAGQKLTINVNGNTATPPGSSTTPPSSTTPSSPSPSGSTAPPPPDSSARSLSITSLSATFLFIFVAFLY